MDPGGIKYIHSIQNKIRGVPGVARGGDLVLLLADGVATLRTPELLALVVSLAQKVAVAAAQLF